MMKNILKHTNMFIVVVTTNPSGLIPEEEDYFMDYGQKSNFMLIHDYNPNYTWFGNKDWTREMINAEYEKERA